VKHFALLQMAITALLIAVLASSLQVQVKSPVEKVVELVTELQTKINADGANEQKIYDKFACWCESTTQRKANNIDTGKEIIGSTTTNILSLKGAISVLGHEISELEKAIANNNEAMDKLTAIRQKENGEYQYEKGNMETAISALHRGIETLSGAGTGGDTGFLSVVSGVRTAVLNSEHLSKLSDKDSKTFKQFLENPSSLIEQEPADYYDQKAQAKASYSPQSATVTGILKDMYDEFAANLENSNTDESNLQKAYEDLMAQKEEENKTSKEAATLKEGQKAEKEQRQAEAEQKLEATQAQLKEDEDFFAATRDQCKSKSDDWDERTRARTEELNGIHDALEILTSDESRAMFATATETRVGETFGSAVASATLAFVQIRAESDPREKAYRAIKKSGHSLRLASLAVAVRTAATGHFDSVISNIDTTLQLLKDEAAEDVTQRDWCIEDTKNNQETRDNLQYAIEQLAAKIARAESKKVQLNKDVARTEQDKQDLIDMMAQALIDRTAENAAGVQAKSDDTSAVGLLEDAIAALSTYSTNNLALLQRKHKKHLKQPEMEVSEDQAPDATFSSQGAHAGEGDGIVQMLTQIKEDLEAEIVHGTAAEALAAQEYADLVVKSDAQIAEYDSSLAALASAIAETDAEILADTETKTDTEGQHEATVNYLARIKSNCDWITGAFTKRAEARAVESKNLMQAKAILSGAEGFTQLGFLQSKSFA